MPGASAIASFISHYGGYAGIGTGLVFLIMILYTHIRMARLHRVYNRLTRNSSGGSQRRSSWSTRSRLRRWMAG